MPNKILKIATIGCSHSSHYAGKSWPDYLKEITNCKLDMAYSSGAGNEMNIEKIKILLDRNPDLLIVQLTDPARFTLPITNIDKNKSWPPIPKDPADLTSSHFINGNCFYTFNPHENEKNLEKLINKKITVDKFILNHVLIGDYNLYYKVVHTMCTISFMAMQKNIPLVFFSWVVDIHEIIEKIKYTEILKGIHIIPDYVENFTSKSNILPIPRGEKGAGHYADFAQKQICEDFILPYLKKHNLI